jgi:small-conductance mechanosensitive channel
MASFAQYFSELIQAYAEPTIKTVIVVLLSALAYSLFSRALAKAATEGYLDYHLRIILSNIVKWLLIVIVALFTLGFFGGSVAALWAGLSGVLALIALGFVAVWSVLSNVLCSILLIIFPPFRIGDEIEIQEPTAKYSVRGKVISIDMFMTSLECTHVPDSEEKSADYSSSDKKDPGVSAAGKKDSECSVPDKETFTMTVPNNIFFQKYVRCFPQKDTKSIKKYMADNQEKNTGQTT